MCHALFLAAPIDLPQMAPTDPPTFSVESIGGNYQGIRQHFPPNWSIRYLGSSSGCSCSFHGKNDGSRQALRDYLSTLPAGTTVQLYDCWEGECELAVEENTCASIADLSLAESPLAYRRLVTMTT